MGILDIFKKVTEVRDDRGLMMGPERLEGKTIILLLQESYKDKARYDRRRKSFCVICKDPETSEQLFFETSGVAFKDQMEKLLNADLDLEEIPLKIVKRYSKDGRAYFKFRAVDKTLPKKLWMYFR